LAEEQAGPLPETGTALRLFIVIKKLLAKSRVKIDDSFANLSQLWRF
jgi:hypothetical protein